MAATSSAATINKAQDAKNEEEIIALQFEIETATEGLKGQPARKIVRDGYSLKLPVLSREIRPKLAAKDKHYKHRWAGDSKTLAICTQTGFVLRVDAVTKLMSGLPVKAPKVMEVAISNSGQVAAYGGMHNNISLVKYDASGNPEKFGEWEAHEGYISQLVFTDEDSKLISGSGDGTIKVWDVHKRGEPLQTFIGHDGDVTGVAMRLGEGCPNIFGSSSTDKMCRMWDLRMPSAYRCMRAKYSTNCCALMPQGRGIVAGCDNASWEYFDTACNAQVARGKVKKGRCESIALSKSGRVTYTGWDGDTGLVVADTYNPEAVQKKIVEQAHTDTVYCLSVSPDGTALASSGFDGVTKIWTPPASE